MGHLRAAVSRLGGMVVAPRRTLSRVLAGDGDGLEPLLLALCTVIACHPATVLRYALLAHVDVGMAFGKLLSSNGFLWTRLQNEGAFCLVAAAGFVALGWLRRRPFRAWDALSAGMYLYVPMSVLALGGAALARLGWNMPWLPHHPPDGWWVLEGNVVHFGRFYAKLVVEMAWPAAAGLATAWQLWTGGRTPRAPATSEGA